MLRGSQLHQGWLRGRFSPIVGSRINRDAMQTGNMLRRHAQREPDAISVRPHLHGHNALVRPNCQGRNESGSSPWLPLAQNHGTLLEPLHKKGQTCQQCQKNCDRYQRLQGLGHCRLSAFTDTAQTLGRGYHIGQTNAEFVVHHHHFTLRNQITIDQHIHGLSRQSIQLHNRTLS